MQPQAIPAVRSPFYRNLCSQTRHLVQIHVVHILEGKKINLREIVKDPYFRTTFVRSASITSVNKLGPVSPASSSVTIYNSSSCNNSGSNAPTTITGIFFEFFLSKTNVL